MSAEGRKEQSHAATAEPSARVVAAAFVAFVAVWSAYFAISEIATAIHNDMAEAYVWGQEFQLGYNQHPPFFAWIAGLWFLVFPRAGWAFAILSTINAGIGLIGAWRLVGRFARGPTRVAATAMLLLTPFYTFLAYKYNANSIFLSLWPWMLYFFVRSLDERKLGDAALFGLFVGLALLSKYYALILVATCGLAALQHPERRRWFAGPSPWLAAAVAALVVAPHLWWLATHGAPPLRYLARVSGRGYGATARYAATAFFGALAQNAIAVAAAIFVAGLGPAAVAANARARWREPRFRMLAILTAAPLLLTVAAAFVLRNKVSTNMLIATFPLAPLLAIEATGARNVERLARAFGQARGGAEPRRARRLACGRRRARLDFARPERRRAAPRVGDCRDLILARDDRQAAHLCWRHSLLRQRRRLLQRRPSAWLRRLRRIPQSVGHAGEAR